MSARKTILARIASLEEERAAGTLDDLGYGWLEGLEWCLDQLSPVSPPPRGDSLRIALDGALAAAELAARYRDDYYAETALRFLERAAADYVTDAGTAEVFTRQALRILRMLEQAGFDVESFDTTGEVSCTRA